MKKKTARKVSLTITIVKKTARKVSLAITTVKMNNMWGGGHFRKNVLKIGIGGLDRINLFLGPNFVGSCECFLFQLHPQLNIYDSTPFNTNYQVLQEFILFKGTKLNISKP